MFNNTIYKMCHKCFPLFNKTKLVFEMYTFLTFSGILIITINITFSVMNEGLSWHNMSSWQWQGIVFSHSLLTFLCHTPEVVAIYIQNFFIVTFQNLQQQWKALDQAIKPQQCSNEKNIGNGNIAYRQASWLTWFYFISIFTAELIN